MNKPDHPSARLAALSVIQNTLKGQQLQGALNLILSQNCFTVADQRLCADLAYGYFRAKTRLERILREVLNNPAKLPLRMRIALALGVYALFFQDKIPDYAAVGETVKLIKNEFGPRMAGVANGALRSVQKLGARVNEPAWYGSNGNLDIKAWALFYAMPEPIANLWLNAYGSQNAIRLMRRSFQRPYTGLRLNAGHPDASRLKTVLSQNGQRIGKMGYALNSGALPSEIAGKSLVQWQSEGALSFQAAGSMMVMEQLGLFNWQKPVWDCCAGIGNKSQALMERNISVGLATDSSWERLRQFEPGCRRLKMAAPPFVQASILEAPVKNWHGNILLDAPCSGLGVLARRPDIRLKSDKDLAKHSELQLKMLCALGRMLNKNCELAYITCTLNPSENEQLIKKAIAAIPGLKLSRQWQTPHDHPWLEGMYGAVLIRI